MKGHVSTPEHPVEQPQRPLRGTKAGKQLPQQPPKQPRTDSFIVDSSVFTAQLDWAAPLTKTADPTRNFNVVRFTGTQMQMTDGIAGIALPIFTDILKDVAVPSTPLFLAVKSLKNINSPVELSASAEQLEITAPSLTIRIPRVATEMLPVWPTKPTAEFPVGEKQLSAILNVAYGISKNPNSLISLQAVALRKNVAIAANESRIVLQPTGFGNVLDTLLMDRFLMLLQRGHADPILFAADEGRVWAIYEDGTEVWGAVPAVPWPESTDAVIKTHFARLKGVKPDVTWKEEEFSQGLNKVLSYSDEVTVTTIKNKNAIQLKTSTATGEAISMVNATAIETNISFTTHSQHLLENVSSTNQLWLFKDNGIVVMKGDNGHYIIMGTMVA